MRTFALIMAVLICSGCVQDSLDGRLAIELSADGAARSSNEVWLCDSSEPGDRLEFSGRVLDYDGKPLSKAAVVAYQADRDGRYNPPDSSTRVPRLRGVAVTDEHGGFRFVTVRPGPYPDASEPAHIHVTVTAPAHQPCYVTVWFEGDPLITAEKRELARADSETTLLQPNQESNGVWFISTDIQLVGN